MSDIITCSKCGGSGKFIYKSGVTGHCYQCNGKGAVKRIAHKSFAISIVKLDTITATENGIEYTYKTI